MAVGRGGVVSVVSSAGDRFLPLSQVLVTVWSVAW